MAKELKRTPASEWRVKTELVQLPSGKVAELKRLNLLEMISRGDNVPNFLLAKLSQSLNGNRQPKVLKPESETFDAKEGIDTMLWMAKQCYVYPKIVEGEPQTDDEVSIGDISRDIDDLLFVMDYGIADMGLIKSVERFRQQQNGNVEPIPASESMAEQTE